MCLPNYLRLCLSLTAVVHATYVPTDVKLIHRNSECCQWSVELHPRLIFCGVGRDANYITHVAPDYSLLGLFVVSTILYGFTS